MTYRPDQHEWRRATHGLGAAMAWDLLDTLMDFPVGMPVPVAGLGTPRLQAGPPGVVSFPEDGVTRQIVPAVRPSLPSWCSAT